ncbi:hypothetical protein Tco_0496900 [Tanacetum coccineum]
MSTQQDIYAAGSKNRPPMLNKENYVTWSSRLLHYAKIKPNRKLIYNFIVHGPYVRRMIPEPGDPDREVPVAETFHEQTDEDLTEKEVKQMEVDDQAIQIILMGLSEDIYTAVDSCEIAQEIWLRVQQMMKGSDIGIQDKKTKLFNEWEWFTSTDEESTESYYHCFLKLMNDFKRNKHFPEKIASNLKYEFGLRQTDAYGWRNQVVQNAVQNSGIQNVGNQNGLIVVPGIANQNLNPNGNGNVVAARAEGSAIRNNGDLEEIEEVNANCILMANLQQASTSGTQTDKAPVYDSDRSAEVHHSKNCYNNDIFNMFTQEEQYTELLEPIPEPHQVQQNDSNVISVVSNVEQSGGTVEHHPATAEETRALYDSLYNNLATKVETVNSINRNLKETNAELTTELARYKNQENSAKTITTLNKEIEILNNQLSKEKSTVSSLQEEKKKLKSDFKIREDELLDKQIQLENKIKELDNILVKMEADDSLAKHKALEFKIERLLRAVVSQDIMSIVQSNSVVDTSNLQTELDRTKEKLENCIIKKEKEYAVLWNNWYTKCEECKYDKISKDTPCKSDTLDPLSQKLQNENVELEFQLSDKVSEQNDTTNGTSMNTQFCKQSILRKPPSYSGPKLYSVTHFPKSKGLPKIDESHALSKPVTSNSVLTPQESKVVKNDKVIAPGIFRINPFKTSREEKPVPNKPTKASVRTKPITISQPHVITKKDVNSDSNGLSSTGIENTAKTRRPHPRSNTKHIVGVFLAF